VKTKSGGELKQVIAVRHGEYGDGSKELNAEGFEQIEKLAKQLKTIVKHKHKVAILSSPLTRAKQSAEIIAKQFVGQVETCDELRSDGFGDGAEQMEAILKMRNGADVVIAVTHYEAPSGIINAFSQKLFGLEVSMRESEKGDGLMLCLKTGKVSEALFQ